MTQQLFLFALLATGAESFVSSSQRAFSSPVNTFQRNLADVAQTDLAAVDEKTSIEPKEAVKLFGRLAEKYIMLDESGGMCCYSACSDCEYREPGGGYRMADQSASRPKWIPVYENRNFESSGKEHTTKWSSEIFSDGPAVNKETFISAVCELSFSPPLGGPYVSASAGGIDDITTAGVLFDMLAGEKEKLTKHRMGLKLKEFAAGEDGVTWPKFIAALSPS